MNISAGFESPGRDVFDFYNPGAAQLTHFKHLTYDQCDVSPERTCMYVGSGGRETEETKNGKTEKVGGADERLETSKFEA